MAVAAAAAAVVVKAKTVTDDKATCASLLQYVSGKPEWKCAVCAAIAEAKLIVATAYFPARGKFSSAVTARRERNENNNENNNNDDDDDDNNNNAAQAAF